MASIFPRFIAIHPHASQPHHFNVVLYEERQDEALALKSSAPLTAKMAKKVAELWAKASHCDIRGGFPEIEETAPEAFLRLCGELQVGSLMLSSPSLHRGIHEVLGLLENLRATDAEEQSDPTIAADLGRDFIILAAALGVCIGEWVYTPHKLELKHRGFISTEDRINGAAAIMQSGIQSAGAARSACAPSTKEN